MTRVLHWCLLASLVVATVLISRAAETTEKVSAGSWIAPDRKSVV